MMVPWRLSPTSPARGNGTWSAMPPNAEMAYRCDRPLCRFVALLYVAQRSLQYFPERRRTAPRAIGLPEAQEAVLDTTDGERVIVWHVPPREGRPVFLYFHGNGGSLRWRDDRFRALITDGSGLVALSYRGYAGSSGRPTESGLVEDAAAAYRAPRGLGKTEAFKVFRVTH